MIFFFSPQATETEGELNMRNEERMMKSEYQLADQIMPI